MFKSVAQSSIVVSFFSLSIAGCGTDDGETSKSVIPSAQTTDGNAAKAQQSTNSNSVPTASPTSKKKDESTSTTDAPSTKPGSPASPPADRAGDLGVDGPGRARKAAAQVNCKNQLRAIGLAVRDYQEAFGQGPFANEKNERDARSCWRVRLLPFLGKDELYKQIDLKGSATSEKNVAAWKSEPNLFNCPAADKDGATAYLAVAGNGVQTASSDGSVIEVLVVEVPPIEKGWLALDDETLDDLIAAFKSASTPNHRQGFHVLLANGDVKPMSAQDLVQSLEKARSAPSK